MADNLERSVGELHGKMDSLNDAFREYARAHDERHKILDTQIDAVQAHMNQAKGAKAMFLMVAGGLGALLTLAAEKIWK